MATIELGTPGVDELTEVLSVLREWQSNAAPMQLHPGDLGWYAALGDEAAAAAVRTWRRDGRVLAVGLLDGAELLRMTTAPDARRDHELAQRIVEDLVEERGVLPAGRVAVEAPTGTLVMDLLATAGWQLDDPWTPLRRDLRERVEDPGLRIETIGPDRAHVATAVHRASFGSAKFTDERWRAMASGPAFGDARCLVGYDDQGSAVAMVTVWSAGRGRPGLLEPLGVSPNHRGHGYGAAMSTAAALALQDMGSSSAMVCTPSANLGAVATYKSAGFQELPERRDRYRAAQPPPALTAK